MGVEGLASLDYAKLEKRVMAQLSEQDWLEHIMRGQCTLTDMPFTALGQLTPRGIDGPTYHELGEFLTGTGTVDMFREAPLKIVGNCYRGAKAQSALRNKNPGNRVLVIREPANPYDENALAVLVARSRSGLGCASSKYDWVHVGYIPRDVTAQLAPKWPQVEGIPVVAEGILTTPPAYESNPEIKLTGWRLYH